MAFEYTFVCVLLENVTCIACTVLWSIAIAGTLLVCQARNYSVLQNAVTIGWEVLVLPLK